jgi:hypothetical protein
MPERILKSSDPVDACWRFRVTESLRGEGPLEGLLEIAEEEMSSTEPSAVVTTCTSSMLLLKSQAEWLRDTLNQLVPVIAAPTLGETIAAARAALDTIEDAEDRARAHDAVALDQWPTADPVAEVVRVAEWAGRCYGEVNIGAMRGAAMALGRYIAGLVMARSESSGASAVEKLGPSGEAR